MACSKIIDVLPRGYGFVVLTGVATTCFTFYMASKVVKARKEHDVPYPIMYDNDKKEYNCVQRAHQSLLEIYPTSMFLLFTGGLCCPLTTSLGGVMFLTGKAYSAVGYASGDPEKRKRGIIHVVGLMIMLGTTCCFGFSCLGFGRHRCMKFPGSLPFQRVAAIGQ